MSNFIEVTCDQCGKIIKKERREHKRRIKVKGQDVKFFRNLSCTRSYHNKHSNTEALKEASNIWNISIVELYRDTLNSLSCVAPAPAKEALKAALNIGVPVTFE